MQIGYEPYIMMHRDYVPFYDERFRGYYWCGGETCPARQAVTGVGLRCVACGPPPGLSPLRHGPLPACRNKVQHLMHISLQNGFNFLVHPTAFVVHVPHKKPSTKWLTRKMGQVGRVRPDERGAERAASAVVRAWCGCDCAAVCRASQHRRRRSAD